MLMYALHYNSQVVVVPPLCRYNSHRLRLHTMAIDLKVHHTNCLPTQIVWIRVATGLQCCRVYDSLHNDGGGKQLKGDTVDI